VYGIFITKIVDLCDQIMYNFHYCNIQNFWM